MTSVAWLSGRVRATKAPKAPSAAMPVTPPASRRRASSPVAIAITAMTA